MNMLLSIGSIAVLFVIAYWRWEKEESLRGVFWPAFFLKLFAGIAVGVVYTYYYPGGDTFNFFHDGVILTEWGKKDFIRYVSFLWSEDESEAIWTSLQGHERRVLFFSGIVSLVNFVTGNNYWITSLYFSFFSFLCSITLVRTIIKFFPQTKSAAVLSFLFLPSVVFWGSGVVKECVVLASLFFLAAVFLRIMKNERQDLKEWLLAIFFCWLLWKIKYYYAAVFLVVTVTSVIVKLLSFYLNIKRPVIGIALWIVVFFAPLFIVSLSKRNFHSEKFFNVVVDNSDAYQRLSKPGSAIQYHELAPDAWSIVRNAPFALFSGLFRPFFWEAKNAFQLLASFENAMLFLFTIVSLTKWKRLLWSTNKLLIFSVIVYCVLLGVFLSLSAPNFGTLSRYRTVFLPFLFFLLSCDNNIVSRFSTFMQRSFLRLVP